MGYGISDDSIRKIAQQTSKQIGFLEIYAKYLQFRFIIL